MNKTLYLPLKAKWYNMIESGEKTEEYREIKPYWEKRIGCELARSFCHCCIFDYLMCGEVKQVRFSYGYTKRTMTFEVKSITVGYGKIEWGAPVTKRVFIIKLGKRL